MDRSRFGDILRDALPMARQDSDLLDLGLLVYFEDPAIAEILDPVIQETQRDWSNRRWLDAVLARAKASSRDVRRLPIGVTPLRRSAS